MGNSFKQSLQHLQKGHIKRAPKVSQRALKHSPILQGDIPKPLRIYQDIIKSTLYFHLYNSSAWHTVLEVKGTIIEIFGRWLVKENSTDLALQSYNTGLFKNACSLYVQSTAPCYFNVSEAEQWI